MGLKSLEDVTAFRLNNEIKLSSKRTTMLHKDKGCFLAEENKNNTKAFWTQLQTRFSTFANNYIESFIEKS